MQKDSKPHVDIMNVLDGIGSVAFPVLRFPLSAAVGSYFQKISIRNPERVPRSGPVLVIANHPATLSEVFLLGTRLRRRFHFLAASFVFQPWPRGALARFCGALPIYRRQDSPELTHRNEDVFRACHSLFDRHGAIVIFPEGESLTDRAILPLKTGAARLALGYESMPGRAGKLTVLPVGLYFSDRTSFQSEVVVSVGRPIDLRPFAGAKDEDAPEMVRQLTAAMQQSLEALILNVPNDAVARFVHDVERLYLEDLREERPGEPNLDLIRRIADCIHYYRAADPERMYDGWKRTVAYWRKLDALGVADPALRPGARSRAGLLAVGVGAGFIPALIGILVNLPPLVASGLLAKAIAPQEILVSSVRILAGIVVFPLTYGLIAAVLRKYAGWSWGPVAVALVLCVALGYFALLYLRWLQSERGRLRFVFLASRHRRLVAKLRAERKALIRMFDEARRDYLTTVEGRS